MKEHLRLLALISLVSGSFLAMRGGDRNRPSNSLSLFLNHRGNCWLLWLGFRRKDPSQQEPQHSAEEPGGMEASVPTSTQITDVTGTPGVGHERRPMEAVTADLEVKEPTHESQLMTFQGPPSPGVVVRDISIRHTLLARIGKTIAMWLINLVYKFFLIVILLVLALFLAGLRTWIRGH